MRKHEQEIRDIEAIEAILTEARVCRVGLAEGGLAYVVPVYFAYARRTIYFHSATEGRKVDMMRRNPRVAFEVTAEETVIPGKKACTFGASYRSVLGTGVVRFLEDEGEKREALDVIMTAQSGRGGWSFEESALARTLVVAIEIRDMTGKQSGHPELSEGA